MSTKSSANGQPVYYPSTSPGYSNNQSFPPTYRTSCPPQSAPYDCPPQSAPYGCPPQSVPYGCPPQSVPYGCPPQSTTPYGCPPQSTPYGCPPQSPPPYSCPPQSASYGCPPQSASYGCPPQSASYGCPPQSAPLYNYPPQSSASIYPPQPSHQSIQPSSSMNNSLYQRQPSFEALGPPSNDQIGFVLSAKTSNSSLSNSSTSLSVPSPSAPCASLDAVGFEYPRDRLYPEITVQSQNTNAQEPSLQKTPLPPNLVTLWKSSKPTNIFFVQKEGHVVSPSEQLPFVIHKCPTFQDKRNIAPGSLSGFADGASSLATVGEAWRLGLGKDRSFIVHGMYGEYALYDRSTNPARCVVIILPKGVAKEERQRLDVLLRASSLMMEEPSNAVDKLEGGMGSIYEYLTDNVDSVVKKGTPTIHKNTKWIRKGTGSLIKVGSGLVSKGVHLVSDKVMDRTPLPTTFAEHLELIEALRITREAVEAKKVSYVVPLR